MKMTSNSKNGANTVRESRLRLSRIKVPINRKFLFASFLLHAVVFGLLFFSWQSSETIKPVYLSNSIHARVLSLDEVKQLQSKKRSDLKKIRDKKRLKEKARKKKRLDRKKALDKKKALKQKKLKAAAKKKQQAKKRKADNAKKLQLKKQKDQRLKKEKQKIEKERINKELKEKELKEKLKQDADKKAAEEKRLLERRKAIETEKRRVQQEAAQQYELSELERFYALIRTKIESRWHIPPTLKGKGLSLDLRIRLLPTGELLSAEVVNSSGNRSLDQSAENTANSIRRYPVPEDSGIFDRNFRQFTLHFAP